MVRTLILRLACVAALTACALPSLSAQQVTPPKKKVALLVGVNAYQDAQVFPQLKHAEDDVNDMAAALRKLEFKVVVLKGPDATRDGFRKALKALLKGTSENDEVGHGDLVLVMFSGHGQQLPIEPEEFDDWLKDLKDSGLKDRESEQPVYRKIYEAEISRDASRHHRDEPYFCPWDAQNQKANHLIKLNDVVHELKKAGGQNLVFVDACRTQPDDGSRCSKGVQGSENFLQNENDTIVYFSCKGGQRSYEDDTIKHGFFTECLLKGLQGDAFVDGVLTWNSLAHHVETMMMDDTKLRGRIRMAARGRADDKSTTDGGSGTRQADDTASYQVPVQSGSIDEAVLYRVPPWRPGGWEPMGAHGEAIPANFDIRNKGLVLAEKNRVFPRALRGPYDQNHNPLLRGADGKPVLLTLRLVTGRRPFYMLETKVWNDLYALFSSQAATVAGNKWKLGTQKFANPGRLPVTNVAVQEADAFSKWLKEKVFNQQPVDVRLPSKEEWDLASGYDGSKPHGGLPENAGPFKPGSAPDIAINSDKPRPVGEAADDVSPFGIRDMAGNGLEWTDNWSDVGREGFVHDEFPNNGNATGVLRGQYWEAPTPRTYADRDGAGTPPLSRRGDWIGFRVVVEVQP